MKWNLDQALEQMRGLIWMIFYVTLGWMAFAMLLSLGACGRTSINATFCTIGSIELLCDRNPRHVSIPDADRYICVTPIEFDAVIKACRLQNPIPDNVVFCSIVSKDKDGVPIPEPYLICEDGKSHPYATRMNDICVSAHDFDTVILRCAVLRDRDPREKLLELAKEP